MKTRNIILAGVTVLAVAAGATGCAGGDGGGGLGSNSITKADYQGVYVGETSAAVRAALGKPETIDNSTIGGLGKSSLWTYSGPNDTSILLTFGQKGIMHPHGPLVVQSKSIG
jgi:hypothetical protein